MKTSITPYALALALLTASDSYAQETAYLGLQYGSFMTSDASRSNGDHEDINHLGISLGANLLPTVGLEAQYTTSLSDKKVNSGAALSSQTVAAYAKIQTPTDVYVNGRVGVARVDYDLHTPFLDTTDSTSGVSWGVGLGIKLASAASIEANYTRLPDLDDNAGTPAIKNELVTVGVNLHF